MAYEIKRVEYFYTTIADEPGGGHGLLSTLAELGINLLAFAAIPVGPNYVQLALFPDDSRMFEDAAGKIGLGVDGPHPALLVLGDDELGALADIHMKLSRANVHVFASNGVTDGRGSFGYVIYIRPARIDDAIAALGI